MGMWSPWRGCHRHSEGCRFCYIHKGNSKRGIDTNEIVKTEKFTSPVDRNKKGEYKIKAGQIVYLCFSSDFLLPEADQWRDDCWKMMKERLDLHFIFLTKRIERFFHFENNVLIKRFAFSLGSVELTSLKIIKNTSLIQGNFPVKRKKL